MTTATLPQAPEKIVLSKEVLTFVTQPIVIKSNEQNLVIADRVAKVKGEIKRLDADRKSFTDPINKVIDAIIARYKTAIVPLQNYEIAGKNAMATWNIQEAKRIAQENARLQAEADEKARKEAEKATRAAEKAEAKGNVERAEELRQRAENVVSAPVPVIQQQKASGVSFKTVFEVEVIDPDLVPHNYLMPDVDKMKVVVNSMEGRIVIPGVKILSRQVVSSKSR